MTTISLSGPSFALEHRGHTLIIPCTEGGLQAIRRILRADERTSGKFGTDANPTQGMIEEWLRANAGRKAQEINATLSLEELGI